MQVSSHLHLFSRHMFITFEGPDGSGKTTQFRMLAEALTLRGIAILTTREPGGTVIGNAIRSILLDSAHSEMDARTEALLYFAARAQLVHQVIQPALSAGQVVICDRYVDSSYAYQGYARNQSLAMLRQLAAIATGGLMPTLTIYLDIDAEQGIQRKQDDERNRFEEQALDFHRLVRAGYHQLMAEDARQGSDRWVMIDASQSIDRVHNQILEDVLVRMPNTPTV